MMAARQPNPVERCFICPDCRLELSKLEAAPGEAIFRCPQCHRDYPVKNRIINLLPKRLEKNKKSEELTWAKGGYFTAAKTGFATSHSYDSNAPWASLVHKHNEVRYFTEVILPKYPFEGRVLEIGSGIGYGSALVKNRHPGSTVIASDISTTALENSLHMADMMHAEVDYFVACDCEHLPFADNTFDTVFGSSVLHHLLEPKTGVAEILRILRQGGCYLGNGEPAANKIMQAIWKSRFGAPGDIQRRCGVVDAVYSFREWADILGAFSDVQIAVEKRWEYKLYHWFPPLYYKALSLLPDFMVRSLFLCGVSIIARK